MNSMTTLKSWLPHVRRELPALARGGAWLFAAGSLFPLLWLIGQGGSGDVFHAVVRGQSHSVWLLHYQGFLGGVLLWTELLAVSAAIIATVLPGIPQKFRRIGHGTLIGWNALWMLGTLRLGLIAPGLFTIQGLFMAALFACTVNRARLNWHGKAPASADPVAPRPPSQSSPPTDIADTVQLLRVNEVESGPAVKEIRSPRSEPNFFAPSPRKSATLASTASAHGKEALAAAVTHSLSALKLAARKARTLAGTAITTIRAHRAAATTSPPTSSA